MQTKPRFHLLALAVLSFSLLSCSTASVRPTTQPASTPVPPLVFVSDVVRNPEAFRDKLVRINGYGIIVATMRLCPGYVGLDRRARFVDARHDQITAEVIWEPSENTRLYDPRNLRVFEGHIRIFSGEIGCPGTTNIETFPYFQITAVR